MEVRSLPQIQTLPSSLTAKLVSPPAAMATAPVRFATRTGAARWMAVPSPSSPTEFRPHDQTVPSFFNANPWFAPAATATISARLATRPGVVRTPPFAIAGSPRGPKEVDPQLETVPSALRAKVELLPSATAPATGYPAPLTAPPGRPAL